MASTYIAKSYSSILADMEAWIIANQDKITDFNEGSGISSFCEAISQQIEQIYLRGKIGFTNYLPKLPIYVFGFSKKDGSYATTTVIFSRSTSTTSAVTISSGTQIETSSGLIFETTEDGTIAAGETDSDSVSVQAVEVGEDYNVSADTITVFVTTVTGVDSVTNSVAATGGTDEESDNDFETRFSDYILGLGKGNTYGIETAAKTVDGVNSAKCVEHFPAEDDYYNVTLYIEDGTGTASDDLLESVEDVVEGDGSDSNPGYRPAGINIKYTAPTLVTISPVLEITTTGEIDDDTVESNVETAITEYINGLEIGEDFILNELVKYIMSATGVYDVSITSPTDNTTISTVQVARIGTITITFST